LCQDYAIAEISNENDARDPKLRGLTVSGGLDDESGMHDDAFSSMQRHGY